MSALGIEKMTNRDLGSSDTSMDFRCARALKVSRKKAHGALTERLAAKASNDVMRKSFTSETRQGNRWDL